jgi:hypothetical protein
VSIETSLPSCSDPAILMDTLPLVRSVTNCARIPRRRAVSERQRNCGTGVAARCEQRRRGGDEGGTLQEGTAGC